MRLSDITFQEILVKDLVEFAENEAKRSVRESLLAVPPWRAAAQSLNPNALPEDTVLIVARIDDEIVGYMGAMPGCIRRAEGIHRVFFLSTFLTSPKVRGMGVGKAIISRMFNHDFDYVLTGASESAERLYNNLGLPMIGSSASFSIYFGEHNICYRIARKISHSSPQIVGRRFLYPLSRRLLFLLRTKNIKKIISDITDLKKYDIRLVKSLSEESMVLRDGSKRLDVFWRSGETINWMLNNAWILRKESVDQKVVDAYFFSSARDEFSYLTYELYQNSKIEGFVIFSYSVIGCGAILKLLDYELPNSVVAAISLREALRLRVSTLELPIELSRIFQGTNIYKLGQIQERPYWARPVKTSSQLIGGSLKQINLANTDGDLTFV